MQIKLTRDEFLRQLNLPHGGDLPDYLYFDGVPVPLKVKTLPVILRYPRLVGKFTTTETLILNELFESKGYPVPPGRLLKFLSNQHRDSMNLESNRAAVHIGNLRRKIRETKMPFYIETRNCRSYVDGGYIFRESLSL